MTNELRWIAEPIKDSPKFQARWMNPRGPCLVVEGFDTKDAALEWIARLLAATMRQDKELASMMVQATTFQRM